METITLTSEYQLVSSIPLTYGEYRTYAKYTSQSTNDRKTSFKLIGCYKTSQNYVSFDSATSSIYGDSKSLGYTTVYSGETRLHEVYGTINHNNDGSSPEITINTSWNAAFGGGGSSKGTIKAPKIDILATFTQVPTSITDESAITFSYSNPANFKVKPAISIVQDASIGFEGDYITTSPYTWNLLTTDANKTKVYDIVKNSPNATARLKLNTYDSNGNFIGSTMSDTSIPFTLVNCSPTIAITCTEQNTKVKNIVGSNLILLNNVSSLKVAASVATKKGASVAEVWIQGKKVSSPYSTTFNVVGSAGNYSVNASVKDSRQITTTAASSTYQLVDYRPVSIDTYSFKRENPTSSKIKLNAEITYWNVTLNGTANAPTISYSTNGSTYTTIPSSAYTIDNTNHTITIDDYEVTSLDYKSQGTYYLKIVDKFTEDKENQIVTKGIPVLELGENDVQVNGTLYIADESRENAVNVLTKINNVVSDNKSKLVNLIYPVGSIYMSVNSTSPQTLFGGTWVQLKDRFLLGAGSTYSNGATGGSATHTLTVDQIPSHNHTFNKEYSQEIVAMRNANGAGDGWDVYVGNSSTGTKYRRVMSVYGINNTGGGQSHNNMPPYLVVYMWKRTA